MENEQLIKEQLTKLPTELQQAIALVPWKGSVKEIALANNLSLPQISALDQETMLVLYGFDDPRNYIDNLVREVGVDENSAITIAEAVNAKIFTPVSVKADELGKKNSSDMIHNDLPMVEKGEEVHSVPHDTKLDVMPKPASPTQPKVAPQPIPAPKPPPVSQTAPTTPKGPAKLRPNSDTPVVKKNDLKTPDYRYPGGADPYREPLA